MSPTRRHLLVCRAPTGPHFISAIWDGKWSVDGAAPRRLEVMLLTLKERLLHQVTAADLTIGLRPFKDFDCPPDEFALPDNGTPVALACRISQAPHEKGMWGWLTYHSADEPPLPSGQRFAESKLEDEVTSKLRLDMPAEVWAADREIWCRSGDGWTHAELVPGAA